MSTNFFSRVSTASLLLSASTVHQLQSFPSHPPEVIVVGRANVGKSMLLNAILGRSTSNPLIQSSKSAGKTKTLDFYSVGPLPSRLVLVDSPGYGARGRPEWGQLWHFYVSNRQQLTKVYILINATHGVTPADRLMLESLQQTIETRSRSSAALELQTVITKCDKIHACQTEQHMPAIITALRESAPSSLPPILTSARIGGVGITEMRESIIAVTQLSANPSSQVNYRTA